LNPYAAPKAKLEHDAVAGSLWRAGNLVRIDRGGALPDRCLVCNQPAEGYRLSRSLYCVPPAWKWGAPIAPFAVLFAGVNLNSDVLMLSFWPLAIILFIANVFIRKSMKLAVGLCPRHRRIGLILQSIMVLCFVGVFAPILPIDYSLRFPLLMGASLGLLVLGLVQSFTGIQRLTLKELTGEHAWLGGTGSRFRDQLPELPG
jgi:hypothetical protein